MTNLAEQFDRRRTTKPAAPAVPTGVEPMATEPGITPQEFYQELVERPDVQRILTRLAQINDGTA